MVKLKLIPVHSGDTECSMFDVELFVRKHLIVGNEFIDSDGLKQQYPHLEPIPLKIYSYSNVEMIVSRHVPRNLTVGVL